MKNPIVTQEWILDRFDALYPVHLVGISRLLIALRRHFDGDLDAMLILLTISSGTQRDDWREALLGEYQAKRRIKPTNAASIAEATGIPRETVRRKLETMGRKGWIERTETGQWEPTLQAVEDLRPATWETITYLRTIVGAALEAPAKERR